MVVEAMALKIAKEDRKAAKEEKVKEWKSNTDSLKERLMA